jgi:Mn-dependent DtxR family transcriptional regulator
MTDYDYTEKQGQYLAFIYNYTVINGRPPSEMDMQRFFRVSPPTVHQMVLKLEERGFITREPGKSRTISVLVPPDQLPYLKERSTQGRSV